MIITGVQAFLFSSSLRVEQEDKERSIRFHANQPIKQYIETRRSHYFSTRLRSCRKITLKHYTSKKSLPPVFKSRSPLISMSYDTKTPIGAPMKPFEQNYRILYPYFFFLNSGYPSSPLLHYLLLPTVPALAPLPKVFFAYSSNDHLPWLRKIVRGNLQIQRCGAFPCPPGNVIVRAVTRAEPASKVAGFADRHTA